MNTNNKFLKWLFAATSIVWVWQLDLPIIFHNIAIYLGATKDSYIYTAIVNGLIPISIVLLVTIINYLYDKLLWRYFSNSCFAGSYVYSLVAKSNITNKQISILGYFAILHTPDSIVIPEGHSFYHDEGEMRYRGRWNSNNISISSNRMIIIFHMDAPYAREFPSQYEGIISIERQILTNNKGCWDGIFHDLGDRSSFSGPICMQRVSRSIKDEKQLSRLLKKKETKLIQKACSLIDTAN